MGLSPSLLIQLVPIPIRPIQIKTGPNKSPQFKNVHKTARNNITLHSRTETAGVSVFSPKIQTQKDDHRFGPRPLPASEFKSPPKNLQTLGSIRFLSPLTSALSVLQLISSAFQRCRTSEDLCRLSVLLKRSPPSDPRSVQISGISPPFQLSHSLWGSIFAWDFWKRNGVVSSGKRRVWLVKWRIWAWFPSDQSRIPAWGAAQRSLEVWSFVGRLLAGRFGVRIQVNLPKCLLVCGFYVSVLFTWPHCDADGLLFVTTTGEFLFLSILCSKCALFWLKFKTTEFWSLVLWLMILNEFVRVAGIGDDEIHHYQLNLKESASGRRLTRLPSNLKNGLQFRYANHFNLCAAEYFIFGIYLWSYAHNCFVIVSRCSVGLKYVCQFSKALMFCWQCFVASFGRSSCWRSR